MNHQYTTSIEHVIVIVLVFQAIIWDAIQPKSPRWKKKLVISDFFLASQKKKTFLKQSWETSLPRYLKAYLARRKCEFWWSDSMQQEKPPFCISSSWEKLSQQSPLLVRKKYISRVYFSLEILWILNIISGFNVETVEYKNISFTVWDVGGQDKIR